MTSIVKPVITKGANLGPFPTDADLYNLSGANVSVQRRSPELEAAHLAALKAAHDLTSTGLDYTGDAAERVAGMNEVQRYVLENLTRPVLDAQGNQKLDSQGNPMFESNMDAYKPYMGAASQQIDTAGQLFQDSLSNLNPNSNTVGGRAAASAIQSLQDSASRGGIAEASFNNYLSDMMQRSGSDRAGIQSLIGTSSPAPTAPTLYQPSQSRPFENKIFRGAQKAMPRSISRRPQVNIQPISTKPNIQPRPVEPAGGFPAGGTPSAEPLTINRVPQTVTPVNANRPDVNTQLFNTGASASNRISGAANLAGSQMDRLLNSSEASSAALAAAGLSGADAANTAAFNARLNAANTGQGFGQISADAKNLASTSGQGGIGAYESALGDVSNIADLARGSVQDATSRLQSAGDFGQGYAEQGIGSLAGTTDRFAPDQIDPFMNTFEDAAVQQALADIQRQSDIQAQGVRARAAAAGAFGGSRQAVQESELARNTLEQQGRTAAQMRQAGFESAAQRAQQAFEQQQARAQQAAQLTGALGAQGSQAALQAAQQQGQLGLSAEQLAQSGILDARRMGLSANQIAGQLGLSAEQLAASNLSTSGQLSQSAEQLAGQLGMSSAELQARVADQASRLGMSAEQLIQSGMLDVTKLGLTADQLAQASAQAQGQLGLQVGDQMLNRDRLGLEGFKTSANLSNILSDQDINRAKLFKDMSTDASELGQKAATGMTDLSRVTGGLGQTYQGLSQSEKDFLFSMGTKGQSQAQAELDATRKNTLRQMNEPREGLAFYMDVLGGFPSGQTTLTNNQRPAQPSSGEKLVGTIGQAITAGMGMNQLQSGM